ncbi:MULTISPECIES: hypothetical protein [unclassified Rhodanobacter]|uniref:hypothetical protein n=1 Tax=unclassified Rhodanobacter TaxID=2621553 RepID=UPI0007AA060C|nr:hypothetical protein [Rhodanobacter sp. FW510-R10]KZC30059.1 hypothetical protein RhoFW510R10_03545 [Rhodanobacter sp. FW510-R10]
MAVPYYFGKALIGAALTSSTPARRSGTSKRPTRHAEEAASGPIPGPTLPGLVERIQTGAVFYLDTNILMESTYTPALDRFLDALAAHGAYIPISATQREEIQQLRKSGEPARQSLASAASRWLTAGAARQVIRFLDALPGPRTSYLDNEIVRAARAHLADAEVAAPFVYVVTDDVELSGRLHSAAPTLRCDPASVVVVTGRQFAALTLQPLD